MDLSAQQMREFPGDSEAKASTAVFAAGAGIGLLECFKDDALLLGRDANAGIRHLKNDN